MSGHEEQIEGDVREHAHEHEHEHLHHDHHNHEHHHHHHDEKGAAPDRSQALLSYMVGHNGSHAEEMREAADGMQEQARALVLEAADLLDAGTAKLKEALALLEGE